MTESALETESLDPDVVAANPPPTAIDPKLHFQSGPHEGKWLEYDERGVPTKTIKKKKLTKKEKDMLETEHLEAQKQYAQYLQDMEAWEVKKVAAERALEKSDRLRWAFRQLGHKRAGIEVGEIDDLLRAMGWTRLSRKELTLITRACADFAGKDGLLGLEGLRGFIQERLASLLLEERLRKCDFDDVAPDTLYSPRTWRNKLAQASKASKDKKSRKSAVESPRAKESSRYRSNSSLESEDTPPKRSSAEASRSPRRGHESPRRPPESPRRKSPKDRSSSRVKDLQEDAKKLDGRDEDSVDRAFDEGHRGKKEKKQKKERG